jgi:hypothetical protein
MRLENEINQGQANERSTQESTENSTQLARQVYQCGPGGPIVSKPSDCMEMDSKHRPDPKLPSLELFGV